MNRRRFGLSLASTALSLSKHGAAQARDPHPIDDGQVELAIECVINHTLGAKFVRVLFSLQSNAFPKELLLFTEGSILVNGVNLELVKDNKGAAYVSQIPFTGRNLNVEFKRSRSKTYVYTIELPIFTVAQYPKTYQVPDPISFRMTTPYVEASRIVLKDVYGLDIYSADRIVPFVPQKLPSNENPEASFSVFNRIKSITPGLYPTRLYRQQRIPMSEISSDFSRGHTVMSIRDEFKIEVLG
jgi:hypothetical protein